MSNLRGPPPDPDILSLYHKHRSGTIEHTPPKKWVDTMEELVVLFLGKLFGVKLLADKPLPKVTPKKLDLCFRTKNVKDVEIILYKY